jgi:transposase-like protein
VKKRFSEEQIIGFQKEVDAGVAVKNLCRRHDFLEASCYLWRNKFGGMDVTAEVIHRRTSGHRRPPGNSRAPEKSPSARLLKRATESST